jgi:uncharacterized protein YukE
MAILGVEIEALRSFARQMDKRAAEMQATMQRITQDVAQLNWVGPDRDRFVNEWNDHHVPSLQEIVGDLGDAVTRALKHAADQEAASSAH